MWWQQRVLPKVACLCLCKQERGVDRSQRSENESGNDQQNLKSNIAQNTSEKVEREHYRVTGNHEGALHQPAAPLRPREDHVEAQRVLEIPNQQETRDAQEAA